MINISYILKGDERKIYLYKSLKLNYTFKIRASNRGNADILAKVMYPNLIYVSEFKPIKSA